ncbi:unnamed protein product [Cochlearia groenlandica]
MKNYLCCLKGEGSSQVVQEPPQPPQPPVAQPSDSSDSTESVNNDGSDDELHPFGNNERLNNAWLNNIELPDDRNLPETSVNNRPSLFRNSGVIFHWREILQGTDNLAFAKFLGQGSFGEVYRCDFTSIDQVGAIKIQTLENAYARPEYMAETTTLRRADHPNVVKILGTCVGTDNHAIVYEFMPKGSLDHHLFGDAKPGPGLPQEHPVLDWDMRMRIAVGVAEGLVYLHKGLKVIHRDINVSNVLLDEGFVPKLTDFGLATKILEDDDGNEVQRVISLVKGSRGCIAPETEEDGYVTTKSDVYSYGVFLFTLFTGRKAYDLERPLETRKITDWLEPVWSKEENVPMVMDVALGTQISVQGSIRLFEAARMCINPQVLARPDMDFVESMVRDAAAFAAEEWPENTERFSI